jgi:predicted dehydrogenase
MPLLQILKPIAATSASTVGGRWDRSGNTPDGLMSTIHFGDTLVVNMVSSALNTTGQRPMLRGELGSLEVCAHGVLFMPEQGPEQWIPAPGGLLTAEQLLLLDWVEAVRGEHAPLCPLSLGLAAQETVDLSLAAYGDGNTVWQA